VGIQLAVMGLVAVAVQGFLIRGLVRRFGETALFMAGAIVMGAGMAAIAAAPGPAALAAALAVMALGGSLSGPTLTSLISQRAASGQMGLTIGGAQALSALGRVVGPVWGGALYALSARLPFVATAGMIALTAATGLRLRARSPERNGKV
jgi:MFS family permease